MWNERNKWKNYSHSIKFNNYVISIFCGYLLYDKYVNNEFKGNSNLLTLIEGKSVEIENKNAKLIKYNDYYAYMWRWYI